MFEELYFTPTEEAVDEALRCHHELLVDKHRFPFGSDEKLFGIVRGRQSGPIAALIEKVTNSIDPKLMKKCFEAGIDPRSPSTPRSMEEARSTNKYQEVYKFLQALSKIRK